MARHSSMLARLFHLACLTSFTASRAITESNPTVKLDSGLTVNGFVDSDSPAVNQFLGIPYAEPPVDSLRWLPPKPYSKCSGSINATQMPPSCIQANPLGSVSVYTQDVPQLVIDGAGQSEDCLTVSVWAPNTEAPYGGFPVLIWIYGGAYVSGGTDVPYQIPTPWVQRSKDVIVVAMNYRLNIFGFPNAAGLDDQNLAMLDQRLAVEWVRDNIAHFGGDPTRLTLWGQSAGAGSVDIYNYAWHAEPIVSGLIMDSGTTGLPLYSSKGDHSGFARVAELANCTSPHAMQALDCLRSVPARTIETLANNASLTFDPVPDGKVVFSNYSRRAERGLLAPVPAIIGTNAHEGTALVTYDPAGVNQTAAAELTLSWFFCPALETSRWRADSGVERAETYRYLYSGNFSDVSPRPWLGAYHSSELPMLFGTYGIVRGDGSAFEKRVSRTMQDAWVRFAAAGAAGLKGEGWPEYQGPGGRYRFFVDGNKVEGVGRLKGWEARCG